MKGNAFLARSGRRQQDYPIRTRVQHIKTGPENHSMNESVVIKFHLDLLPAILFHFRAVNKIPIFIPTSAKGLFCLCNKCLSCLLKGLFVVGLQS